MATKIEVNKIYHCQASSSGSLQVLGGSAVMYGSNVTEYDNRGKMIIPSKDKFVKINSLSAGITAMNCNPEWVYFTATGSVELWGKCIIDCRILPVEAK